MNRPIRQLRLALAAMAALVGLAAVDAHAAAESELGQLTVSTAPAGYSISTDPSALSGDYSMGELAELTGQSLDQFSDAQLSELGAFGRTWAADDGSQLLLLLLRTSSDADAAAALNGILDSAGSAGYPTGVAGTIGRIIEAPSPARIVAWRQGPYAVQILSVAPTAEAAEAAAKQLATDQVAHLTAKAGRPGRKLESDGKGIAYAIGRVAGFAAMVALVIFLVTRRSRRRAAAAPPWMGGQPPLYPGAPPTPWQQGGPPSAPWQQGPPSPPPPPPSPFG